MSEAGIEASKGVDPTVVTAWVFALLGYTPIVWYERLIGYGHFGPLAWPAILAMVGVLFAVIAILRSIDLKDATLRNWAIGAFAVAMLRLFVGPML